MKGVLMNVRQCPILVLLLVSTSSWGAVYKCNTPDGVVFSQTPCAEDAEEVDIKNDSPGRGAAGAMGGTVRTTVTDDGFDFAYSPEELVEKFGQPAAKYTFDGTSHWFYPNGCKKEVGGAQCPEYLMENGTVFQITWLSEAIMIKSVTSVRKFAGWSQPATVSKKRFTAADTGVVGENKTTVTSRFGPPDAKRVFNGRELWEYRQVPMGPSNPDTLTIFLEFEGNKVFSAAGN
jgi:hypothetical protein